jgi:DNA-binding LytR/AlgR family response regulator
MEVLRAEDDPNTYEELTERLRAIEFHDWPTEAEAFLRKLISDWSGGGWRTFR